MLNRGVAPDVFLNALIDWAPTAPPEIFTPRKEPVPETDIYTAIKPKLWPGGPWTDLRDRTAGMMELLRVLAAFESSYIPTTGADASNRAENNDETYSAGLWQISHNSRAFGQDLRDMLAAANITNGAEFQAKMKDDFNFAATYTARLLRRTIRHNGPTRDGYVEPWLSRGALEEFKSFLPAAPAPGSVTPATT